MKYINNRLIKLYYVMLFAIFTFTGCSSMLSTETTQGNDIANENYDKGRSLLSEGKPEEAITYYLLALDNVAILPEDITEDKEYNYLKNNIHNDLSEAYYQLNQYETSLEYIELALNIKPNRYFEYVNIGNALYSLGRNEEAEENYKEALTLNDKAIYAIYGLGSVYFNDAKYEEAIQEFKRFMELENNDIDAITYIVDCYTQMGDIEKGIAFIDEMLKNNKDNIELEILPGKLYYDNEKYDEAVNYFMELSKKYPEDGEISSWIVYCYEQLDEFDHILEYVQSVTEKGFETEELYNAVGYAYLNKDMYMESVPYFKEAIRLNREEVAPYLEILNGLYNGKRYSKCIEFGMVAAEKFPEDIDIPWYIGDCYYNLSDYSNALLHYKNALALDMENEEILAQISDSYLMLEDYKNANEYAEKTLAINSDNNLSIYVKETISDRQSPIGEQLHTFIKDSYLYSDEDRNTGIAALLDEDEISNKDIVEVVEKMRVPDDLFTFVISDKEYDSMMYEMEDEVKYNVDGNQVYIRLNGFYVNTDNNIIEILDEIEDTESKNLVIDLRSNTGGLTDSANNILDILLPECVTSTLISRDGYTYNYYSDASHIKFNKIYIFVDEYSASASELLTLGLKTYLNNVTIVGKNTYGKGVGQTVFEDKERKLLVYLVNHYWNVRQQNIMSTGITPDIYVKSNALEDYMKVIVDTKD